MTGDVRNVLADVAAFVRDSFLDRSDPVELEPETRLVSTGLIDSAGLVLLLSFVENKYGVTFSVEELASADLDTLSSIVEWVEAKLGSEPGTCA